MDILVLQGLLLRMLRLEVRQDQMTSALEALTAAEAKLEQVVAAISADNQKLHAELTAALNAPGGVDEAAVQAVADKIAAQTETLGALLPAAVPTDTPPTEAAVDPVPPAEPPTSGQ